jgi:hypothetical protein
MSKSIADNIVICKSRQISPNGKIYLFSDIHIGSAHFNEKLFVSHLKQAKKEQARILINGDLFDVVPLTDPRFSIESMDKRLLKSSDFVGAQLRLAENILRDFAVNIDMIGTGNHETGFSKRASLDILNTLIFRLNSQTGSQICYGGYCGFIKYAVEGKSRRNLNIFYHHGWGNGSRKTKGIGNFADLLMYLENVDVVWLGHLHEPLVTKTSKIKFESDGVKYKDVYLIRTSGYYNKLAPIRSSGLREGYYPNYVVAKGIETASCGCGVIELTDQGKSIKVYNIY